MRPPLALALLVSLVPALIAADATAVPAARGRAVPDALEGFADPHPAPYDFRTDTLRLRLDVDPEVGEARLEFESGAGDSKSVDRYFLRRGRIFQVNERGEETPAAPLGDLSPATLAALHPVLTGAAILDRRENFVPARLSQDRLFAWNEELWRVAIETPSGHVTGLERQVRDDLHGDGREDVHYEDWVPDGFGSAPRRTVVMLRGREAAQFHFEPAVAIDTLTVPAGDPRRDRSRTIRARDVAFREIAPHLYAADLVSLNTRVFVAEFTDHLAVIEGAFGSRICDVIAGVVRARFQKPVRWFAFSHLHGQYSGGVRTWIHEGATILVPPSTAPLIADAAKAARTLEPDAQAREPRPLKAETVESRLSLADSLNALDVLNVPSGHTDEYLIFHFPRLKILLCGDLYFYRPGKPVTGRSKQLCETVARMGLEVEQAWCTWPLEGYGTKSVVNAEEWRKACAAE
jgi:glyoxylase-like metal-dependent hydrolase (beta-lactamase superfamily II)